MGIFQGEVKQTFQILKKNKIYRRRKYEIEPIFGNLRGLFGFTRFTVRSKKKVNRQMRDSVNGIEHVENVH